MRACAILDEFDRVVAFDILRPHDAGDDQFAHFVVDPHLLLAFDDEIAVWQNLRHHAGDIGLQILLAIDRALAFADRCRVCRQEAVRDFDAADKRQFDAEGEGDCIPAEKIVDARVFRIFRGCAACRFRSRPCR